LASIILAIETSVESVNPFNEYMGGSNLVNQFSGDATWHNTLASIDGKNSEFDLSINYSSNINTNVRAQNTIAPDSWTGLGWSLGVGNIRTNHKGTKDISDDDFYYVSPTGVSQRILKKSGTYFLEKNPYWKVTVTLDANSIPKGWVLIDKNGTKYEGIKGDRLKISNGTG